MFQIFTAAGGEAAEYGGAFQWYVFHSIVYPSYGKKNAATIVTYPLVELAKSWLY